MTVIPPDLEERFHQPENWQWNYFERVKGRRLRYGFAIPDDAETIVFYLPGLAEPAEKAFETGRNMLERGCGFAVMDWFGQGGSGRYLPNPHKRHAGPFEDDLADFHECLTRLAPKLKGKKLVMLAHSMGGNLGLRYLHDHPSTFESAAFTAPMIGIYAVKSIPPFITNYLAAGLSAIAGNFYVMGGGDWKFPALLPAMDKAFLSSDPVRAALQNQLFKANPEIVVSDVTYGWIYHAYNSCAALSAQLSGIQTHVLLAAAGKDFLVDSAAIKTASSVMSHATFLEFPDSRHEILMERDEIRDRFLSAFYDLI